MIEMVEMVERIVLFLWFNVDCDLNKHVHRIGRTGRNQCKGYSRSFLTRNLSPLVPDLVELLKANSNYSLYNIMIHSYHSLDQPVPRLVQDLAEEQKRLVEFGKWEVGLVVSHDELFSI